VKKKGAPAVQKAGKSRREREGKKANSSPGIHPKEKRKKPTHHNNRPKAPRNKVCNGGGWNQNKKKSEIAPFTKTKHPTWEVREDRVPKAQGLGKCN